MQRKLSSATLLQLAFPGERNPNFPWEKSQWDMHSCKKESAWLISLDNVSQSAEYYFAQTVTDAGTLLQYAAAMCCTSGWPNLMCYLQIAHLAAALWAIPQSALLRRSVRTRHHVFPNVPTGLPSCGGDVAVYIFDINQPSLPTPFYSVLVSISIFMALSNVFHFVNSPDYSPLSHSVLLVLSLPYWSFQLYISLGKSPSALI